MSVTDGSSSSGGGSTGETRKTNKGNTITLPTPAYMAPAGASLGQSTETGGSLTSTGAGQAIDTSTGSMIGTATGTKIGNVPTGDTLASRGGGGPVATTVTQQPAEGGGGGGGTTGTGGRSDFSQVLAAQIKNRSDRAPSRSTNFVSLVGGAGGLGRRSENSRRTLIGGA